MQLLEADSTNRFFRAKISRSDQMGVVIDNGSVLCGGSVPSGVSPGLLLLFERGGRPDPIAVRAGIATLPNVQISHGPDDGRCWMELLVDGLTFDLIGLEPGPLLSQPMMVHRFGLDGDTPVDTLEAVAVVPGPHIASGAHTVPVVRALAGLGVALANAMPNVRAVCWSPARSVMGVPVFSRIVESWLNGGPFPSLGFTGFNFSANGSLRSEGLNYFIGQEVELVPALTGDRVGAARLAARVIHELVAAGHLGAPVDATGEGGMRLRLEPTPGGDTIRVKPV